MRLAYFSPLAPQRTGIADYSEEILPALAEHADLELFVSGYEPTSDAIRARFRWHDAAEFRARWEAGEYDLPIYQVGNSLFHECIWNELTRTPGLVVLHDPGLHHFIVGSTVGRGRPEAYVRELGYCHGLAGIDVARAALAAGVYPYERYALNRRVVDSSLGVIVHSEYARTLLEGAGLTPVRVVPHHVVREDSEAMAPAAARAALGLPAERLIVATFGLATAEKRIDVALRAFRRLWVERPDALFVVVGGTPADSALPRLAAELGLADSVRMPGFVDRPALLSYMAAADVCVSLRWPTLGETSGAVLRLLNAGKATIVTDVGWFRELPDAICLKTPAGEGAEEAVAAGLLALAEDAEARLAMGERARAYVRTHNTVERLVAGYIECARELLAGRA